MSHPPINSWYSQENQIKILLAQEPPASDNRNVLYLPQFLSFSNNKHLTHVPEVCSTQDQHNVQAMWFNDF